MAEELDALLDADDEVTEPVPKVEATGETTEAPPAPAELAEPDHVPMAAVIDERRKRQAAEQRLAEIEEERNAIPRPDVFEDPDGAFQHQQREFDEKLGRLMMNTSKRIAKLTHDDFDQREVEFVALAQGDPQLIQAMWGSEDPAEYAYQVAVKAERMAKLTDVDAFEAKVRAEIEAKVRAELSGTVEAARNERAATPSLATVPGVSSDIAGEDDESLEALLGR